MASPRLALAAACVAGLAVGCGGGRSPADAGPDAAADGGDAGGGDGGLPEGGGPGSVETLDGPCRGGSGGLAATFCVRVGASCPGLPDLAADLLVTPAEVDPAVGTALLSGPGEGTTPFHAEPGGLEVVGALAAEGFTVVERVWDSPGWTAGSGGPGELSCRSAALVRFVRARLHEGGCFAAVGLGEGAAEATYGLARWGTAPLVDLVVAAAGPSFGRLDLGCLGEGADPDWPARCERIVPLCCSHCSPRPPCTFDATEAAAVDAAFAPATPCGSGDAEAAGALRAASVGAEDAALDYGATALVVLLGEADCTVAVPLALEHANRVTSARTIEFVGDTGHDLAATVEGRDAIVGTVASHCR